MNLWIKIISISVFCYFNLFSQECTNILRINSDIPEVNIFINDSLISANSNLEIELQNGVYVVLAEEFSDRWNSKSFCDTIYLSDCETKTIHYYFNNEVLIETIPTDAYVFANDSLIGFTPVKIPANLIELKILKPGYLEKKVLLEDNSVQTIRLDFNGIIKDEPFVNTTMFKILTGSAVALGAITAYFKLKADDKFDEYRFSGNRKYLDETNRYDTISGISLALFQINFGYIIYRFLAE
ncbi:MAG: PEGA domain-containing protein [Ignavibacterium sp.]